MVDALTNPVWHLETDASTNPRMRQGNLVFAGGGIVLRDHAMKVRETKSVELGFVSSATHGEYLALLSGLDVAYGWGARALFVRTDNRAIVEHYAGEWRTRSSGIPELLSKLREGSARFESFTLKWAPTSHRRHRSDGAPTADSLARLAARLGERKTRVSSYRFR